METASAGLNVTETVLVKAKSLFQIGLDSSSSGSDSGSDRSSLDQSCLMAGEDQMTEWRWKFKVSF